jgi:hypothetical protein
MDLLSITQRRATLRRSDLEFRVVEFRQHEPELALFDTLGEAAAYALERAAERRRVGVLVVALSSAAASCWLGEERYFPELEDADTGLILESWRLHVRRLGQRPEPFRLHRSVRRSAPVDDSPTPC